MYQNDNRWSSHQFVNFENKTIGKIGCALTAMANGMSALANYQSILAEGPEVRGYTPDFMNKNSSKDDVGADFEKFANLITKQTGLKTTLIDTKNANQVKNQKDTKTAALVFAHMKTSGSEGEHWININAVNKDGSFNGSDVLAGSDGKTCAKDYSRSNPENYDRFIIIKVEIE